MHFLEQTPQPDNKIYALLNGKGKFTFQPPGTINQQIIMLKDLIKNKQWKGQISIKNFYGTFKQEYWVNLEESLRKFTGITKFTFLNTKLDKEHLILLKSLIQWIDPKEISIKLKHNEIDDLDLEDFLIKWLLPSFGSRIKTFKVVSNPGIFKGNFVSQLKYELIRKSDLDPEFTYHLVRNKEYKSIGFIRILKPQPYQIFTIDLIKQLENSLKQTCYLQLSLIDLFGDENSKALEHLIDSAYHEDKLEFIESLDIKGCSLGSQISMVKMAKKISSSKGLLSLGLSNQKLIHSSQVSKSLNGGRYDQLRLNHIDIGDNKDMSRLALKLMADNLISKSLKSVDFGNTMVGCQQMKLRIKHITDAFFEQIQQFNKIIVKDDKNILGFCTQIKKNLINQCQIILRKTQKLFNRTNKYNSSFIFEKIPKFNLKKLDLALFNYISQRNETIQSTSDKALLLSIILNEFSSVKKLRIRDLDLYRIQEHLSALDEFEDHIDWMKKTNPIYTEFVPRLNSVEMGLQFKEIEVDQIQKLMERFLFTKTIDLLQIRSLQFSECFNGCNWLKALLKLIQSLYTETKEVSEVQYTLKEVSKVQYTLENLTMENNWRAGEEYGLLLFQNVVFSKKFQLKTFIMQSEIIKENEWEQILILGEKFLEQIPLQSFWTLRKLEFLDLRGAQDIFKLVELMVFNDKVRLEELKLENIEVQKKGQSLKSLKKKARTCIKPLPIKIIRIGGFFTFNNQIYLEKIRHDTITLDLLEILVIHPMSQINELTIFDLENNCFKKLSNQITDYQNLGYEPLKDLKSLIIDHLTFESEENWEYFADIFIFGRDINISSLKLHNIKIDENMSKGLNKSYQKKLNYLTKMNEHDLFCNSLKSLIFEQCTFKNEILSLFFTAQKESIKILHIIQCKEVDNCILKFQEVVKSNKEKFSQVEFSLQELNLDNSIMLGEKLFEWFMKDIIFNKKHQKLECLSLSTIKKYHLDLLKGIFQELKKLQCDNKKKNFFKLRKINLKNQLHEPSQRYWPAKNWIAIFDKINPGMKSLGVNNAQIIPNEVDQEVRQELSHKKPKTKELKLQKNKIQKLLESRSLSILQRLLTPKNIFGNHAITFPVQLYRLELHVGFYQENKDIKLGLYNLIFKCLVFYSGSQLRELTLNDVDFDIFMESSEDSFKSIHDINSIPLKYLKLTTSSKIKTNDSNRRFAELYVQGLTINLEAIILRYYKGYSLQIHQNISECINKGQINGKIFSLNRLEIEGENQLDEQQALQFFKIVILNFNLPIQILRLDLNDLVLNSQDNLMQLLNDHLIQQNYKCPLKELSLICENYSSYERIKLILPLFIQGDLIKLVNFRYKQNFIESETHQVSVFRNICDQEKLSNFTISHLNISLCGIMQLEDFKFFYYVRPKLKIMKLDIREQNSNYSDDIRSFLKQEKYLDHSVQSWEPCELQLQTNIDQKNLLEYFAFEESLKWSKVKLKFTESEYQIGRQKQILVDSLVKCIDLKSSLRQLWIDSYLPLGDRQFKLIGEQLIYNESSILEELCLISCDLNVGSIKALTLGAKAFKNKIEKDKLQMKTYLSLRRFCLHDFKSLTNDDADIINGDILFFEYIKIETIEVQGTSWNSAMMISQCNYAQAWLDFQSLHSRDCTNFSIKLADWGFNTLVLSQTAWFQLCDTFLFSDKAPLLEAVNLQYMDLQDQQIDWICQKADNFFSEKPKNYIHSQKRLDLSGNYSLSAQSWQKVSEKLFFPKQVKLLELNIILTALDSQEQLDAIYEAGASAAFKKQNKKLELHTFLTDDIQLKQQFAQIMSERPDDYQELKDKPQYLQNKGQNNKEVQDIPPNTLGQTISIMTKNIYKSKEIKVNLSKRSLLRFSEYHIDIVSGLLNPLNQFFQENLGYHGEVPIDLITCDIFCTKFKYNEDNGDPYPYKLLFSPEACEFYNQPSTKIRVINFIQTETKNAELMNQLQIFYLWQLVRSKKSSLDIVYVDYRLDDDLVELMIKKGYNEREVVNLVRLFPPSSIRLQDTLTLLALKAIYTIMFDNYQFNYSNILFDKDVSLNVGIGYSLRESVYRSNPTGCIGRGIKFIFYHVCNLFVTSVSKYKFSEEIKVLNNFLSEQRELFLFLIFFTIIYYIICLFGPYGWQHFYDGDKPEQLEGICANGITIKGIYSYIVFACNKQNIIIQVFSLWVEHFLYQRVKKIIPKHIEGLVAADEEYEMKNFIASQSLQGNLGKDEDQSLLIKDSPQKQDQGLIESNQKIPQTVKINNSYKAKIALNVKKITSNVKKIASNAKKMTFKKIKSDVKILVLSKNGVKFGYLFDLFLAQLAKLNLYTDVTFILLSYYCNFPYIALFGLISTAFNVLFQLYNLIIVLHKFFSRHNKAKLLSTQSINNFYDLSTIGRNVALSKILDTVAPYNVTVIQRDFVTRSLFPSLAGKSMSNSVRAYVFKFVFGDLPHIILQLYFISQVAKGNLSATLILTIITTGISFLFSFYKFMTIRPSSLSQADFDELAKRKSENFVDAQVKYFESEFNIFDSLTKEIQSFNNDGEIQ